MFFAKMWQYCTRIVPALAFLLSMILLYLSFVPHRSARKETGNEPVVLQTSFCLYMVVLHILSLCFPARAFLALAHVTKKIKEEAAIFWKVDRRLSTQQWRQETSVLFCIIIPAYKEDLGTLNATLRVLASHPYARFCYHVHLAMEEREQDAVAKAKALVHSWGLSFLRMEFSIHPSDIVGDAPGKSSNISWAVKQFCSKYPETVTGKDAVVTVMDADTHLSARFFSQITQSYISNPETRDSTIYLPPLVFDRNLHHTPLPVRTADIIWAGAGISSMYTGSTVCIPTSVYALPISLVQKVGGWDSDDGAIGEDMHMFLKCFFALSGNLNTQVIYAAASQCNVTGGKSTGVTRLTNNLLARYHQALRHMWGALDTGYAIRQYLGMLRQHFAPNLKEHKHDALAEPTKSTNLPLTDVNDQSQQKRRPSEASIHTTNSLMLFYRIFEAHFLPLQFAAVLTAVSVYTYFHPTPTLPFLMRVTLQMCSVLRVASFILMLCYFFRYEKYHRLCVDLRKAEMRAAGLFQKMSDQDGFSSGVFSHCGLIEASLFPVGGFLYGAIPLLQAILSHIFTKKLTYVVSLKPQVKHRRMRGRRQKNRR